MNRLRTAAGTAALATASLVLAACAAATAGAPPAAPDVSAACTAQVRVNAAPVPNPTDPSGPSPEITAAWGRAVADLATVAAGTPAELQGSVAALSAAAEQASTGTFFDPGDPALNTAVATVNGWVHDNCGFPTVDAVNSGTALDALPASVPAGVVSFSLTDAGPPDAAAFVLLINRVRDGADVELADLREGRVAIEDVAEILGAAMPVDGAPAYTTATLSPGHYVLASPLGFPPASGGVVYGEVTVS